MSIRGNTGNHCPLIMRSVVLIALLPLSMLSLLMNFMFQLSLSCWVIYDLVSGLGVWRRTCAIILIYVDTMMYSFAFSGREPLLSVRSQKTSRFYRAGRIGRSPGNLIQSSKSPSWTSTRILFVSLGRGAKPQNNRFPLLFSSYTSTMTTESTIRRRAKFFGETVNFQDTTRLQWAIQ